MPSFAPSTGRREQFLNSVRRQLSTEQLRGCLELSTHQIEQAQWRGTYSLQLALGPVAA